MSGFTRLRVRLALIVAVALAPAGLLAVVQALSAFEASDAQRAAELQSTALAAVDAERRTIVEIKQTVKLAAFAIQTELNASRGCEELFASLAAEHDWMTRAVLLNRQGVAVCGADKPLDISQTEHWKRFIERPDFILSSGQRGRLTGQWISGAYYPVYDPDGDVFAIAVGVDLSFLGRLTNPPPGSPVFALLGSQGRAMNITGEADPNMDWLPENRVMLQQFGDRAIKDIGADGVKRAYYTSELETGQLWAVTGRVRPGLNKVIFSPEGFALLVPALLWAIAVSVSYFAIDILVSRHIDKLRAAAFRIGQGDLDTPVGDFSEAPRELRALGHSIKAMAARISDRDARLQETLEMQRRLLLEVHHRVKNNLQTISSLMNLETRRMADPAGRRSLTQIQDRIHALALVHQNLNAVEHLERVALNQLVRDICDHLETSLAPKGRDRRIRTTLDEMVVDTTAATPIALFLSEAIGNAYRHTSGTSPQVEVRLMREGDAFRLSVSNNAAEPAEDEQRDGPAGLGLRLMSGFARQIDGKVETRIENGRYEVILTAPIAPKSGLFSIRNLDRTTAAVGASGS